MTGLDKTVGLARLEIRWSSPTGRSPPRTLALTTHTWIARVYDQQGAALYRYALMIVGDGDGAEDVVHQVFVKLLAGPAPRDDIRSAEAYLRRAVRNECYSWLRARHRDALEPRHAGGPSLEPVQPTPQEDRVMLEQALRSLPPEQREVVHLKVFEGLTFAQIGDVTGVSSNTAASRYRYAIEKLGAHLGLEQQKPGRTA